MKKCDCDIEVVKIKNNFFGENITVSGLLTGVDIVEQLKGKELGTVLVPKNIFRAEGDITLDGMTLKDIKKGLGCEVIVSENDGYEFMNCLYE